MGSVGEWARVPLKAVGTAVDDSRLDKGAVDKGVDTGGPLARIQPAVSTAAAGGCGCCSCSDGADGGGRAGDGANNDDENSAEASTGSALAAMDLPMGVTAMMNDDIIGDSSDNTQRKRHDVTNELILMVPTKSHR